MKKIICLFLSLCITFTLCLFAGCSEQNRDEILKIYLPGEYMDKDIITDFEKWYTDQTGKNVTVKIKKFDAVENIQREVEIAKKDYDLLCPSDYMVE